MKGKILAVIIIVAIAAFVANSALVIDKGTEGKYTGVVAFDAHASSGSDWAQISSEITGKAEDINAVNLKELGAGKAVKVPGNCQRIFIKGRRKAQDYGRNS